MYVSVYMHTLTFVCMCRGVCISVRAGVLKILSWPKCCHFCRYIPGPFRTWSIMSLHNLLSFLPLDNPCAATIPFFIIYLSAIMLFDASLCFSCFSVSCECLILYALFPHNVYQKFNLFFSDWEYVSLFFLTNQKWW